jgi:uncharacterized protein
MTSEEEVVEIERLKGKMLKKKFFVMQRQMVAPEKIKPNMLAHYQWIIGLEKDNKVFASGPMAPEGGGPGVGLTVFRCESFDQARELASSDPFVSGGAAKFTLAQWQINEGRMSLAIDFSDGAVTIF